MDCWVSLHRRKMLDEEHLAAVTEFSFLFLQTFIRCHQGPQLLQHAAHSTSSISNTQLHFTYLSYLHSLILLTYW